MQLPESLLEAMGQLAYFFAEVQPLLPTYAHLILSALFPIFTGSYASLSRPASAARAKRKKKTKDGKLIEVEEEEEDHRMEGLSNTDVIMFPILAGCTLAGLYFLIKWLGNADLLNKILNWYIGFFSLASVSKLISDGLDVVHSLLFPHDYVDRGIVFHVDPLAKKALPTTPAPASRIRTSALPGIFSRLPLPQSIQNMFWALHILPSRKLTFGAHIHSLVSAKLKLGLHGIIGLIFGFGSVFWYNFVSKPWWLTNLMGFGFSYTALQITSPSTFTTGSMLLIALFFYDIYFVFFTPMMVTVAKELDIPVKLLFPRPPGPDEPQNAQALSMLGLGDIVLPGTLIGLALRFDLYMFYRRKQRKASAISSEASMMNMEEESDPFKQDLDNKVETSPSSAQNDTVVKAPYVPVGECWGDRLWTASIISASSHGYRAKNAFPKPYFHAAITGYFIAMITTLIAMQLSNHPQPALLYLTPGVVGAVWIVGCFRGELKTMWNYSDQEDDEDDDKKEKSEKSVKDRAEVDGKGGTELKDGDAKASSKKEQSSFFSLDRQTERERRADKALRKYIEEDKDGSSEDEKAETSQKRSEAKDSQGIKKGGSGSSSSRTLISFYIRLPAPLETTDGHGKGMKSQNETDGNTRGFSTATERNHHIDKKPRVE